MARPRPGKEGVQARLPRSHDATASARARHRRRKRASTMDGKGGGGAGVVTREKGRRGAGWVCVLRERELRLVFDFKQKMKGVREGCPKRSARKWAWDRPC